MLPFDLRSMFLLSGLGAFPPPEDGKDRTLESTADGAAGHAEMAAESVRAIMSISFCFRIASIW
jgi:hypothetical protein